MSVLTYHQLQTVLAYLLDHASLQLFPQVDYVLLQKLKGSDQFSVSLAREIRDTNFWELYVSASKQASLVDVMRVLQKIN